MDRIFLDANVVFSAAYREGAGLLKLWTLPETEVVNVGLYGRRGTEEPG